MTDLINLIGPEWRTVADWGLDHETTRPLRRQVREYNRAFSVDRPSYILSGVKGYRLTEDPDEIIEAISKDLAKTLVELNAIKGLFDSAMKLKLERMDLK